MDESSLPRRRLRQGLGGKLLTDRQRIDRTRHVGSSDVAAILGLDPYRTAMDVWLEKTGRADPFEGNEATERGNLLEPAILAYASKELDVALIPDQEFLSDSKLILAHTDGVPADQTLVVEAKSAVSDEEYGEPGTDEVPQRHIIQVHTQFLAIGPQCKTGYVALLLPGFKSFDFRLYTIPREEEICQAIDYSVGEFWRNHVLADKPPPNILGSMDVLKRVRRNPSLTATVPDSVLAEYDATSAAMKKAKEAFEAAETLHEESKRAVLQAMGEAEEGTSESGRGITYRLINRKSFTVEATSYRRLIVKKG